MNDHAVLCKVSDVLQSLFERVQGDLRSDSVPLIQDLKARSVVVVRQLQLEFGVGRSEVVLCILKIHDRPHDRLVLVLIGVLLSEQLESDLFAAEEVVYLFELVVARLYICVVYLVLVLLELVAKGHLKKSSRPIRLVVGTLSRDAIGLGYEFGNYSVESRSVVLILNECDLLRRRSDVVLELSEADVADFCLTELHCLYIHIYKVFLYIQERSISLSSLF